MQSLVSLEQIWTLDPSLKTVIELDDGRLTHAMVEEAIDLVEGETGSDFRSRGELPGPVLRVVCRMVVRTLQQETASGVPSNASNISQTAGPFSRNIGFESGSTSGGVWLNKQDRMRLRRWGGGTASTVRMFDV